MIGGLKPNLLGAWHRNPFRTGLETVGLFLSLKQPDSGTSTNLAWFLWFGCHTGRHLLNKDFRGSTGRNGETWRSRRPVRLAYDTVVQIVREKLRRSKPQRPIVHSSHSELLLWKASYRPPKFNQLEASIMTCWSSAVDVAFGGKVVKRYRTGA